MKALAPILLCALAWLTSGFTGEIMFGQSASFSGATQVAGERLRAGILAAFKTVNDEGGVAGRELRLTSVDDQYTWTNIPRTTAQLLNISGMFAFIAFYGSPTTSAVLDILTENKIPDIAPVTGSAAFRLNFNPYLIHLRAGYNDENLAMLNFLYGEKKVKRVGILYQADSYGIPARDGIREAMAHLGVGLSREQSYDKIADDVARHDFERDARLWFESGTQAIIFYGIGDWILSTIKYAKRYYGERGRPIYHVVCSFMGMALNNGLKAAGTDPADVFMTQVYPHPESNTSIAAEYRDAMQNFEGPRTILDYLSLEGWAAARFAIKVLRGMTTFTRESFLKAVDDTKMVMIGDQLAGPFASDCAGDKETANNARSSLCHCNQGFRFVELTEVNAEYAFTPVSQFRYSILDCYATAARSLYLPTIYAQVWPAGDARAAAAVGEFNAGVAYAGHGDGPAEFVGRGVAANASDDAIARALTALVDGAIVVAAAGAVNVPETETGYLVVGALQSPARLAQPFRRSFVHVVPTLQQEIYAWVAALAQAAPGGLAVHVLHRRGLDEGVVEVVRATCAHFVGDWATAVTASAYAPGLAPAALAGAGVGAGPVFVFGLRTAAEMEALVDWAATRSDVHVHVPFAEVAWHWEAVRGYDAAVLDRITFTTSFPNWHRPSGSPLIQSVMAQAQAAGRNSTTALEVAGYIAHSALMHTLALVDAKASPAAVIDQWYWSGAVHVHDMTLGPYSDLPCASGAGGCQCNRGARALASYSLGAFLRGGAPAHAYNFTSCEPDYTPAPAHRLPPGGIVLIAVGAALVLLLPAAAGYRYHKTRAGSAAAPKDPTKPFCIVFTDIQASTHLWATIPEEMAPALDAHHTIIRRLIARHGCYEVKTIGDSFMCASHSPEQALEFAHALQLDFYEYDWGGIDLDQVYYDSLGAEVEPQLWNGLRVRIGIHYGHGSIKRDPTLRRYDYYGTVVNTAARIESVCHGGQIGVSHATYERLSTASPHVVWTDLGMVPLRGLPEPLHIWQALPRALAGRAFPELRVDRVDARDVEDSEDSLDAEEEEEVCNVSRTPSMGKSSRTSRSSIDRAARKPSTDKFAADLQFATHALVMNGSISAQDLKVHHHVAIATLTTLLATQTSKFQEHVLKGLCERLHVPYRGANGRKFQRTLQGLVHRVLPSTVAAGKLGRGGSGPLPRPSPPVHEPLERHGGRVVPVQEVYQTDIYVPEDVELE